MAISERVCSVFATLLIACCVTGELDILDFAIEKMNAKKLLSVRQPANKNVPTNPLLGGTVGSRGSSLMTATPKGDLTLIYLA